jgi:hypothetical protein
MKSKTTESNIVDLTEDELKDLGLMRETDRNNEIGVLDIQNGMFRSRHRIRRRLITSFPGGMLEFIRKQYSDFSARKRTPTEMYSGNFFQQPKKKAKSNKPIQVAIASVVVETQAESDSNIKQNRIDLPRRQKQIAATDRC